MEYQPELLEKTVKNVVIINDFNYIQGGASRVAIDTADLLKNANINTYFFSADNKEKEKIEGVHYFCTNQGECLCDKNKLRGMINGIYNLKAKQQLKDLLNTLDKEETIIHIHGWTKALSSSVFDIAFKKNFKVVLTLHDYFTACPNGGYFNYVDDKICHFKPLSWKCIKCNCDSRNFFFKIYRLIRQFVQNKIVKLNNKIENVITISKFSERILKLTLGKDVNITRIYNPINFDFKETEKGNIKENKYYLYVGRVSKEKGVDLFCKAITDLNLNGIVVGDGYEKDSLQKKYGNINFVGWKDSKEVKQYMKKAKALIFPSRWYEGAGLTILEAQSLGIPCIVSKNCAGSDFIIENENGYLFDGIDELKYKISNINIENFKFDNNNFSKETYLSNLIKLYDNILKNRR